MRIGSAALVFFVSIVVGFAAAAVVHAQRAPRSAVSRAAVVRAAAAPAGSETISRSVVAGDLVERDDGSMVQTVTVVYDNGSIRAARARVLLCKAGGGAALDGVDLDGLSGRPSAPAAVTTFCAALVTASTGFRDRRAAMLAAAGAQALFVAP